MHPAFSVILFTTASGMGYGLLVWLVVLGTGGSLPVTAGFGLAGFGLALTLITAGLLASTFHLGNPQRAWRALSQWRTSWLSREGVLSTATYPFALAFAGAWILGWGLRGPWAAAGVIAALLALSTLVCTGQIYASLKPIPQWHNRWTVPNYLALGLSSGAGALLALTVLTGQANATVALVALVATAAALGFKLVYWRHLAQAPARLTIAKAIGVERFGPVRALEQPHTETNYIQQEMGFRVARRHAAKLRRIALAGAFGAPLLASAAWLALPGAATGALAVLALPLLIVGLLTERWLFFAQAQHVVTLYYGTPRV